MNCIQVWSYGDSLAQPRKGVTDDKERYLSLLREWLIQRYPDKDVRFFEHQRGNSTVPYLYSWFINDDSYFEWVPKPYCLIIHAGICDCAPRPISARLRSLVSRLPEAPRLRVIRFLNKNRAILQKIHTHRFVSPKEFKTALNKWLPYAAAHFLHVIYINIAPTTDGMDAHSPGLAASIDLYNGIISEVVQELALENIVLFDANARLSKLASNEGACIEDYVLKEDGHHLTVKGQTEYFKGLIDIISSFELGPGGEA